MENYYICDSCGETVHCDNACSNDNGVYCESCYQEEEEEEEENSQKIHDYGYKPNPQFQGTGPLYYGIELEVDKGNDPEQLVYKAGGEFGNKLAYYPKHDSSLDNGVEFVTHPYSYDAIYTKKETLTEFFGMIVKEGFTSHNAKTCGLHIHASKAGMGKDKDLTIGNLIYLFERYFDNMLKFSRRTLAQLQEWADRYLDENNDSIANETPKSLINKAKCTGRRHAINLQNSETIEFRFFRGTLNIETFMASIQLIDNMIALCKDNDDISVITWEHIKHYNSEFSELKSYCVKRGI
jgi:hypothetical protein